MGVQWMVLLVGEGDRYGGGVKYGSNGKLWDIHVSRNIKGFSETNTRRIVVYGW